MSRDETPDAPSAAETGERLQKFLAHAGVASRRHAEDLITAGAVTVNGAVVRELGTRVRPGVDDVRVQGRRVAEPASARITVMLNKPARVLSTVSDPHGRHTVTDLLPPQLRAARLYPVGRLDWDTEGLLLLSNDGELALRMTHPRYALPKEYHALVTGKPSPAELERMGRGMLLPGERRPTAAARAWTLPAQSAAGDHDATWIAVEIHEGRNRQVRRMCEAIDHPVLRLIRVRVGPLTLAELAPGEVRPLRPRELVVLARALGLPVSGGPSRGA